MSQKLINHSEDLKRLRDEGYSAQVKSGHLIVGNVPYVNAKREIKRGTLISTLTLAGDKTAKPDNHIIHFAGEYPCERNGSEIPQIRHGGGNSFPGGLTSNFSFSCKPQNGYQNYYEKVMGYINIISAHATSLDPTCVANEYKSIAEGDEDSPFVYIDTNSSRGNFSALTEHFKDLKIGIVGLGGTGSYILDLISKTPVGEIHLFDGDIFCQHNAFRSPGAASLSKLGTPQKKSEYFRDIYAEIHKHVFAHCEYISTMNVSDLKNLDFVFICVDKGSVRSLIVSHLLEKGLSFIDVGMGVQIVNDKIRAAVRITAGSAKKNDHLGKRLSFGDAESDVYSTNIQIAELNMLNASLAVLQWKKMTGFYSDLNQNCFAVYSTDDASLITDDHTSL